MPDFRVSWEIDVVAANRIEAAKEAKRIQRDSDSRAVVFHVSDEAATVMVDLEDHPDAV